MLKRIIHCLLALQCVLLGQSRSFGESADNPVQALMQRYSEVEAQLDRAVHYERTVGDAPETTVQRAWFNEFGGLLKVATDHTGASGRELKEYFPYEPDENPAAMRMFVLTRRENPLPGGAIRVDEERVYLRRSEGQLLTLRRLKKSAEFKAGQPLDMQHVRNVISTPAKQRPQTKEEEAAKRDWEFMEAPKNMAQALRVGGAPKHAPPAADADADADAAQNGAGWLANSVSPDGQWRLRLIPADEKTQSEAKFVISKHNTQDVSGVLAGEAAGTFADLARIIWAPDSKRFAFQYRPGLRYQMVQLFQLEGGKWRELESPDSDDATKAALHRSLVAKRKRLKLPPNKEGRPIDETCEVRKWIDPATALLLLQEHETYEVKNELEEVGDACFVTLKFEPNGSWKVIRTRLLSEQKTAALNEAEREALIKIQEESGDNN